MTNWDSVKPLSKKDLDDLKKVKELLVNAKKHFNEYSNPISINMLKNLIPAFDLLHKFFVRNNCRDERLFKIDNKIMVLVLSPYDWRLYYCDCNYVKCNSSIEVIITHAIYYGTNVKILIGTNEDAILPFLSKGNIYYVLEILIKYITLLLNNVELLDSNTK